MQFQKQVLLIALIILIISIIIITIAIIIFNNRKQIWAPFISKCPDYWKIIKNKDSGLITCYPDGYNTGNISGELGFNVNKYPSNRDKAIFSHKYNIVWDGISNNPRLTEYHDTTKISFLSWLGL